MALSDWFGKKKTRSDVPAGERSEREQLEKALHALNKATKEKGKEYELFQCPNRCVNQDLMDKNPHNVYVQANLKGDPAPSCPTCGATMRLLDLS